MKFGRLLTFLLPTLFLLSCGGYHEYTPNNNTAFIGTLNSGYDVTGLRFQPLYTLPRDTTYYDVSIGISVGHVKNSRSPTGYSSYGIDLPITGDWKTGNGMPQTIAIVVDGKEVARTSRFTENKGQNLSAFGTVNQEQFIALPPGKREIVVVGYSLKGKFNQVMKRFVYNLEPSSTPRLVVNTSYTMTGGHVDVDLVN